MTRFLYVIGRSTAAHPWRTFGAWLVVAVATVATAGAFGGTPQDDFNIDRAPAQSGVEQLREHFPASGAAGSSAQTVVHDAAGHEVSEDVLADLANRLGEIDHVTSVSPPRYSADRDTAVLSVVFDRPVTDPDLTGGAGLEALESAVADVPAVEDGELQVEFGGELPNTAGEVFQGTGELIGIVVALVLMTIVLGTVVAAGLPLVVALVGLAVSAMGVTLLAATTNVSTTAPTVAIMVGLGVGIDYALLLVTRHQEFLRAGTPVVEAAARSTMTAGRSVSFASVIVLVSLMGLPLAGLPVYSSFGFATGIAVVSVAAAALTLVPAACGLLGRRLLPRRERLGLPPRRQGGAGAPWTARWAATVARRPLAWTLLAVTVLVTLAAPTLAMRTWPRDVANNPADSTTRQAYDVIAAEYGAGANAPLTVVVDREAVGDSGVARVAAQLREVDGIVAVGEPVVSPGGEIAVLETQPGYGPSDERIPELLERMRGLEDIAVTGNTALLADISVLLSDRIWLVVGFVVLVSMVLLAAMFRSILVPLKAAALNALSIAAGYGVVVAVFQWGWGADLMGLDRATPVSSWLPILMFAILFGLSMDYEVFLLSRIREEWLQTGDSRGSVVRGVAGTGRVISTAAAVMVAVFAGFATEAELVVRQLGLGMAVAVALDATLVRLVLVPASMTMMGRWNWWLPAWLDRLLPTVRAEVSADPRSGVTDGPVGPAPERSGAQPRVDRVG